MAAINQFDLNTISAAISRGVVDGTRPLLESVSTDANKRHDLRNVIQQNADKLWEVDGEVKLIKGFLVTLIGTGDGNGGMVNRIDRDMETMRQDVSAVKTQLGEMSKKLDAALEKSAQQQGFMDGWKGVGIALGVIGTCITIMGGVAGVLVWLFQHGLRP